jgi:hypothetical protein
VGEPERIRRIPGRASRSGAGEVSGRDRCDLATEQQSAVAELLERGGGWSWILGDLKTLLESGSSLS